MPKILILFDSETGNTRKMAQLVAEGAARVPDAEVRILSTDEASADDVVWCDGIAVGSPTHMGLMSWKMKKFWDGLGDTLWGKIDGKVGCAFSSSGGWGGGNEIACMSILIALMNFGFLVFGLPDYVGTQFTLHYGAVVAGDPRASHEMEACRRLGQRLATWTSRVRGDSTHSAAD